MEFSENLRIGDKVVFKVDLERRAWTGTYKDIPDGTVGVVCGFYDAVRSWGRESAYIKKPGVYWSKGAASVRLDDGRIITGCGNEIDLVDKDEQKRRDAKNRDARNCFIHEDVFIGQLPPTPFWEGDTVECTVDGEAEILVVASIRYDHLHDKEQLFVYTLRHPKQNWQTGVQESDLKLIERGNIWKEEHGEKLQFSSLQEEAAFMKMRGRAKEIRNPKLDVYNWTLEEAISAVESGEAHEITIDESGRRIAVYRFENPRLGRRVAEATLASIAERVG